jgi:hypothetical protein
MSNQVWFILVDFKGRHYKGTNGTKASLSARSDVAEFKQAVKAKNTNTLRNIEIRQLTVFNTKSAFDVKEDPLDDDSVIAGLGTVLSNALIVVVTPSKRWGGKINARNREDR